jgi:K(+)-stimulated pyrophosphate-energized sodium pump
LIKVMNLVSVLIAPAVVKLSLGDSASAGFRALIGIVAFAIIVAAVVVSKRRRVSMGGDGSAKPAEASEPVNSSAS